MNGIILFVLGYSGLLGFAILCSMLTVCRLRPGPSRVRLWAEISPFLVYLLSRLSGQDTIYCERYPRFRTIAANIRRRSIQSSRSFFTCTFTQ
ncbi:hypothetical protein AFLA_003066 [Aspergillus flavus NRRL3357]|nr:hypothetical protein AFLA_003066 [Aspergillus flavus NRRL3357]